MIFFYENFYLKKSVKPNEESDYVGYAGENSEYNSNIVFNDVDPEYMIEKNVDQLLANKYLDIENSEYMKELFSDFKCYFIYNHSYNKYCLPIYFESKELAKMSNNFKNNLWKERLYIRPIPKLNKLDLPRYQAESKLKKQIFGIYMIQCTKRELDKLQ